MSDQLPVAEKAVTCCLVMAAWLDKTCPTHSDPWDCDGLMVTTQNGIAVPVRDGGRSYSLIVYCPWCGTRVTPPERPLESK